MEIKDLFEPTIEYTYKCSGCNKWVIIMSGSCSKCGTLLPVHQCAHFTVGMNNGN